MGNVPKTLPRSNCTWHGRQAHEGRRNRPEVHTQASSHRPATNLPNAASSQCQPSNHSIQAANHCTASMAQAKARARTSHGKGSLRQATKLRSSTMNKRSLCQNNSGHRGPQPPTIGTRRKRIASSAKPQQQAVSINTCSRRIATMPPPSFAAQL